MTSKRPNKQYPQAPAKPDVDLNFRGHLGMVAVKLQKNEFLVLENLKNEEITKIHNTQ
jgi:hypothetical protein